MSTNANRNPEEFYRAGQAPDAQDEADGQRDAAGGHPHEVRRVPPGLRDRAHGGAADALGVVLDQIEDLFAVVGEFGAAYQQFIAERRHLDHAEESLAEAEGHLEKATAKVETFEKELREWHERPRIGRVDPDKVHPGWTPSFEDADEPSPVDDDGDLDDSGEAA